MKEVSFEESKKLLLDILVHVDRFCNQQGIDYSLAYGTLIGAIRHKGFIPWDDDIDIIMRRDDYERFISLFHDTRYEIISGEGQTNHAHIRVSDTKTIVKFSKQGWRDVFYKYGLWIDVFPIDNVPDTSRGYKRFQRSVWFFYELQLTGEIRRKNILLSIAYYFCKPFSKTFGKIANKKMFKYNNKSTHTVADMGSWYVAYNPSFPACYMKEYVDVEFEGFKFKAIKEYDKLLRLLYGDYMQYPPKEDQIPHHDFIAFMKEEENYETSQL